MTHTDQAPIYLTGAGRRRLERRLAAHEDELGELERASRDGEAEDQADAAADLTAVEARERLHDLAAQLRATLQRALPLAAGPDDGVVRQGATVLVRDESGAERRLVLVDGAELDPEADEVAIDAPVGRALLGRQVGDCVAVRTPGGEHALTIMAVAPYRLMTS